MSLESSFNSSKASEVFEKNLEWENSNKDKKLDKIEGLDLDKSGNIDTSKEFKNALKKINESAQEVIKKVFKNRYEKEFWDKNQNEKVLNERVQVALNSLKNFESTITETEKMEDWVKWIFSKYINFIKFYDSSVEEWINWKSWDKWYERWMLNWEKNIETENWKLKWNDNLNKFLENSGYTIWETEWLDWKKWIVINEWQNDEITFKTWIKKIIETKDKDWKIDWFIVMDWDWDISEFDAKWWKFVETSKYEQWLLNNWKTSIVSDFKNYKNEVLKKISVSKEDDEDEKDNWNNPENEVVRKEFSSDVIKKFNNIKINIKDWKLNDKSVKVLDWIKENKQEVSDYLMMKTLRWENEDFDKKDLNDLQENVWIKDIREKFSEKYEENKENKKNAKNWVKNLISSWNDDKILEKISEKDSDENIWKREELVWKVEKWIDLFWEIDLIKNYNIDYKNIIKNNINSDWKINTEDVFDKIENNIKEKDSSKFDSVYDINKTIKLIKGNIVEKLKEVNKNTEDLNKNIENTEITNDDLRFEEEFNVLNKKKNEINENFKWKIKDFSEQKNEALEDLKSLKEWKGIWMNDITDKISFNDSEKKDNEREKVYDEIIDLKKDINFEIKNGVKIKNKVLEKYDIDLNVLIKKNIKTDWEIDLSKVKKWFLEEIKTKVEWAKDKENSKTFDKKWAWDYFDNNFKSKIENLDIKFKSLKNLIEKAWNNNWKIDYSKDY